jgi:hypothetical protein
MGADIRREDGGIQQNVLPALILQPGVVVLDCRAMEKTRRRAALRRRRLCHVDTQA